MYKIVIDANAWIRFARAKDIAPLINRFTLYHFLPVCNNYLLTEIFNALINNKWMHEKQADNIVIFIRSIALTNTGKAVYRISPDPKDNYLFDLAIQNNCIFIISDDTELLRFKMQPVPVYSTTWFLKKFPL